MSKASSQTQEYHIYECDEYTWQVSAIEELLNSGKSKTHKKSDTEERIISN